MSNFTSAILLVTLLITSGYSRSALPNDSVKLGGATTIKASGKNAYSMPAANMPMASRLDFSVGNSFFKNPWVFAPATTTARDGLGPLFNTNGCQNCHIKDGRGNLPLPGSTHSVSMLVRLSIKPQGNEAILITGGNINEPNYGGQLQDFSAPGVKPEAQLNISYQYHSVSFADGSSIELRKPVLQFEQLNYGAFHPQLETSLRMTPAMIGLGLLAAIDDKTLLDLSQVQWNNGVNGRPNKVWDVEHQKTVIGRFGWKAGQPSLRQQNAAAFNGDVGITSSLFSNENCTAIQKACLNTPNGNGSANKQGYELADKLLDAVTFYTHNLAVPSQRNASAPQVISGKALFKKAQCHSCHVETLTTGDAEFSWLSHQTIHPYSDLLLHDLGDGLADNRSEFIATGNEWRTPPLWGIGLAKTVNPNTSFLHDGRARTLLEAIIWHGGEAEYAQQQVLNMNEKDRGALIAFLQSL
ncbi:hypothetical protein SIN8267_00436 [Sinobacterium norvegicum]|uniref:Cytochrome c domain-containing protein n=1 Tax=Sinobacterium norvegicum TaxID=1641715 RepID=A0ABN8ED00_9GAMM|nr:di-heme oxidoredictase family protein [Sinobacterium norvegicum]CAH0990344.1 hypothetical protein SIN8267_00436 [Sinobacterium norvegicum]